MKKVASFLFAILFLPIPASAQILQLPRNPDKLISRARAYWTYMVSGQKIKALDFVVPEKRDAFLAATNALVLDAQVEGMNFTENPQNASVRIQTHTVQPVSMGMGKDVQAFTQNWIWKISKSKADGGPAVGNWYLDIADPKGLPIMADGKIGTGSQIQKDIDLHLTLSQPTLNIGTVVRGGPDTPIDVPVTYSGERPLAVELATPYPGFSINALRGGLTTQSKHFTLSFDASDWESSALTVPLHIRFARDGAAVEKVITVQGTVFAPVTFRQVPPDGPVNPANTISIFIKNNTADRMPLLSVTTDDKSDFFKNVQSLEPNQESEVILRLKPGETEVILKVFPRNPVDGIGQFSYQVRIGH